MIPIAYLRIIYLAPLLLLLQSITAAAQDVVFTAGADASKVGLADRFNVTYTIQGIGEATFNPGESLKEFNVLAGPFRSQSTNMTYSGGQLVQSSSLSMTFVLQAKHTGIIKLPPAVVVDRAGHSYKSNSLQVEVVPGSVMMARSRRPSAGAAWADDPFDSDPFAALRQQQARMRQLMNAHMNQQRGVQPGAQKPAASAADISKDIFIRVDVDKKAVKLGEQVTAIYKLYARIPMQVAISKLPSLNGFWTQDFDIPKEHSRAEEVVNGRRYQVFILKKSALFPQQSGTLTLDAAEAEGTARVAVQAQSNNPFDDPFFGLPGGSLMMSDPFFSDPFGESGYREVPVHLKSAPVHIKVGELPEAGKPEHFTGAVGNFSLSGKLDKSSLTTDNVATLTLTISGSGNLKLFDVPKLVLPPGLDTYEPGVFDTITGRSTTISGQKVVTYSIAPRKAGDYVIPPLRFAWFDPQSNSYKTASTASFPLQVRPGKTLTPAEVAGYRGSGDIRDHFIAAASRPLILSPLYWSMYALPLALLAGITFYRRREQELVADTARTRNRRANKVAQKRLAHAGALLQKDDARGFYDEVSKAIWLYLSDKLNIPLSALGKDAALQAMSQRGIPTPVQQQIEKVVDECELALYASSGNNHQMQQTFSEAACIITGLERTLRTS
jgi:hypothetical protein